MKTIFQNFILFIFTLLLITSCGCDEVKSENTPVNYTVILDLSDRILVHDQLDKDISLVESAFHSFENHARKNLVISSKDRFSIKIIPQRNSPLNVNEYEDILRLYLDETDVADKNKSLKALSLGLHRTLKRLKQDALYGKVPSAYFGVDIWAYLHDNGMELSKTGYENKILILTDGYFDFENQSHVIKNENQFTSTRFLNDLNNSNWKQISEEKQYGLLPIQLDKNTKWIIAGISGKKANDILQTEKITYFWKKWLNNSGVKKPVDIILNNANKEMCSRLSEKF